MNLSDSVQLLERYSVVILPALVVAEQIGIPLPAVPACRPPTNAGCSPITIICFKYLANISSKEH